MGELYLLTGAAGHLGTALVKLLKEKHKKIRALVLPEEKHLSQLSGEDIEIVYGDIRSKKAWNPSFKTRITRSSSSCIWRASFPFLPGICRQ